MNTIDIQLNHWSTTPVGQFILTTEMEIGHNLLQQCFGYYSIKLGDWPIDSALQPKSIRQYIKINETKSSQIQSSIIAQPTFLPVATDSIDVVLLPHVLESVDSPHEVLREVERILRPDGYILIFGFNPWRFWRILHLCQGFKCYMPWQRKFYSMPRVCDWLKLLGFEIKLRSWQNHRFLINHQKVLDSLQFMEVVGKKCWPYFGATYMIFAKKQTMVLTPIKPRWYKRNKVKAGVMIEPTARS